MIDLTSVDSATLERVILQQAVEQFLYKEARLLDERGLRSGWTSWPKTFTTGCPCAGTSSSAIGTWSSPAPRPRSTGSTRGRIFWPGGIRRSTPVSTGPRNRFPGPAPDQQRGSGKRGRGRDPRQQQVPLLSEPPPRRGEPVGGRREDLLRRDSETKFKLVKRKIILAAKRDAP